MNKQVIKINHGAPIRAFVHFRTVFIDLDMHIVVGDTVTTFPNGDVQHHVVTDVIKEEYFKKLFIIEKEGALT